MRFRVLGPVEVRGSDGWTRLRGQQAMLLSHLAAAHPNPVPFGVLEAAFWGDAPPSNPEGALKVAVTRLRRTLGEDLIEHTPAGYVLAVDADGLDRAVFRRLSAAARSAAATGDLVGSLGHATEALDQWAGGAFASIADNLSLAAEIQHLDEERTELEDLAVDLLLAIGQADRAAVEAGRYATALPLRERRWEQLMTALHLGGRSAEALRTAHQYRTMLGEELGLEPGESIRELESAIAVGASTAPWLRFEPDNQAHADDALPADVADELALASGRPQAQTTFIDRPAELLALTEAIDADRIVTVVGAPGVGKTRLVMAWAASLGEQDVTWVDLAVESDETVRDAVMAALGVSELAGGDGSPLAQRLSGRAHVLALDNCEATAMTVAALAGRLVEAHPSLRIVASSRVPLGCSGEHLVRLGPLTDEASRRLLAERCSVVDSLTDGDVEAIIAGADGVPLAIEVAAQRLRGESPGDVAATATGGGELAGIDRLLNGDRDLFVALAPMRGSFDVEAAAHLSGRSEREVRAGLHRLAESSLVQVVADPLFARFRLLEPIRQAAEELADRGGDWSRLQTRHVEFYAAATVERSEGLHDSREERAIDQLDGDAAQVRWAWRFACASNDADRASMLASSWWWMTLRSLSHRDYPRPWETTQVPGFDDSPWKLDVLASAAMAEWARGRSLQSIECGQAAVTGAIDQGEPVPFDARFGLIASYGARNRTEEAHEQMVTLIREAQEQEAWYYLSGAQAQVAIAFTYAGLDGEAERQARAALETAERSDNTSTLSFAHHAMALVLVQSDPQGALSELYESIRLATRVRNRWHLGWTTATLANLYRRLGRHEEAARKLDGLLEHWLAVEMEPWFVSAVLEAALLFDAVGDDDAVRLALTIANEGRKHQAVLPSDWREIARVRSQSSTPAPDRAEARLIDDLRSRLDDLTTTST